MLMTEKRLPTTFARRVKQMREARGLSQQALAVAAGLSISVVTQLEQGFKADPRLSTAAALAEALGVTVDELLREAGEKAPADKGATEKKPRRKKGE
jgi:transcriptional regulator with XRE-family HTH domain